MNLHGIFWTSDLIGDLLVAHSRDDQGSLLAHEQSTTLGAVTIPLPPLRGWHDLAPARLDFSGECASRAPPEGVSPEPGRFRAAKLKLHSWWRTESAPALVICRQRGR